MASDSGPPSTHASAIPCGAYDGKATDLSQPLANLLDSIQLLKPPEPLGENTTAGLIESTTLELTNQVKTIISGLGGGAVVLGGASSAWAAIKDKPTLAAIIAAGVAVILASSVLALAMIMNGDVRGRAAVTAQHIEARGYVASRFLETLCCCDKNVKRDEGNAAAPAVATVRPIESELRTALAAFGTALVVSTDSRQSGTVSGCVWDDRHGLRLRLSTGDVVDLSEVQGFNLGP